MIRVDTITVPRALTHLAIERMCPNFSSEYSIHVSFLFFYH